MRRAADVPRRELGLQGGGRLLRRACVDIAKNAANCGACGAACPAMETCVGGNCSCGVGMLTCNGVCMPVTANVNNCGPCGMKSAAGLICSTSECIANCTFPHHMRSRLRELADRQRPVRNLQAGVQRHPSLHPWSMPVRGQQAERRSACPTRGATPRPTGHVPKAETAALRERRRGTSRRVVAPESQESAGIGGDRRKRGSERRRGWKRRTGGHVADEREWRERWRIRRERWRSQRERRERQWRRRRVGGGLRFER